MHEQRDAADKRQADIKNDLAVRRDLALGIEIDAMLVHGQRPEQQNGGENAGKNGGIADQDPGTIAVDGRNVQAVPIDPPADHDEDENRRNQYRQNRGGILIMRE
ncbi:MAG: hypothetical protein ACK5JE_00560 [Castellaniella sp.]